MMNAGLNLTLINSEVCDIYVKPHNSWHESHEGYNLSRLNLTWQVTSYMKDLMIISLIFNNPEDISPSNELD
jgi:hypothetical protein